MCRYAACPPITTSVPAAPAERGVHDRSFGAQRRQRMPTAGQKRFFGVPLAAGSWCELDTSTLGPGVALTVSQATLAEPLPSGACRAVCAQCESAWHTALPAHVHAV